MRAQQLRLSAPLTITLDVTSRCNLNCAYCYNYDERTGDMPTDRVLELITRFREMGIWQIVIGGGEPFLHPDIMHILNWVCAEAIRVGVITNGTVISADQMLELSRLQRSHPSILQVQVSLDASDATTHDLLRGEGSKVLEKIATLCECGVDLTIGTVLHRLNIHCADQIIDEFYPRITFFHFMGLMPSRKMRAMPHDMRVSVHEMKEFLERLRERQARYRNLWISAPSMSDHIDTSKDCSGQSFHWSGCAAGITRLDIKSNGDVLACCMAADTKIGNVFATSFREIWSSAVAERYRDQTAPLCQWQGGADSGACLLD